jgi:hypothetical protein
MHIISSQAGPVPQGDELKDPTFQALEADFGILTLGNNSCSLRIEIWEEVSGIQGHHFLGQVIFRQSSISFPNLIFSSKIPKFSFFQKKFCNSISVS